MPSYKTTGYTPDDKGFFHCDYEGCGYQTNNRSNLAHHLHYHRKNKHTKLSGQHKLLTPKAPRYEKRGDKYHCKVCGKGFNTKRQCAAHLGFHSIKDGKYKCPVCGRMFTRANAIASHLKAHERRGERFPGAGAKAKPQADKPKPEPRDIGLLPMPIEIEGNGTGEQTVEFPITIRVRVIVEAKC